MTTWQLYMENEHGSHGWMGLGSLERRPPSVRQQSDARVYPVGVSVIIAHSKVCSKSVIEGSSDLSSSIILFVW